MRCLTLIADDATAFYGNNTMPYRFDKVRVMRSEHDSGTEIVDLFEDMDHLCSILCIKVTRRLICK